MHKSLAAMLALAVPGLVQAAVAPPAAPREQATRPVIGPPPAWVLPAEPAAAPAAAEGAATVSLLNDVQARFTDMGDTSYYGWLYRIATPQGLDSGSLQISWDPDLERLTLHRYRLLRDGKTIDLLGDGSKLIVVRREKNLERATLDGRLTASMQAEDLRVGDVVDLAYTIERRDPVMAGRSEMLVGPDDGVPVGRNRIRMLWPAQKKLRWRVLPGVIQPRVGRVGGDTELLSDMVDVVPPRGPEGAPARFRTVNAIELSEFPDWATVSRSFAPYYAKAATLNADSPLKAEIARIAAASADPKVRAAMALRLVEDQVRYVFLGMGDGGYVPAAADLTWSRRFGDCKGKTVLLVALLEGLGIDARPVLVNTARGDYVAERLPVMGAFDHAIVEARIGGRSYWLDGTRSGDRSLDLLDTPGYRVALPLSAQGSGLVPLVPEPLRQPSERVSLDLDASGGIDAPAPARGEMRFRGEAATDMRVKYADMSPADRDVSLRKRWRDTYDFVTPTQVATIDDQATGDFVLTMTGTAKMAWTAEAGTRWYEVDRARVGWKIDITREAGVNRDAPFAFNYPDWWASAETIRLPHGGKDFRLQGGDVDKTVAGLYAFHRSVKIDGGVMKMEVSSRALAPELPMARAEEARSQMAELVQTGIFVRVPDDYAATDGDIVALKDDKPALATAYMRRGAFAFDRGELDASLADEEAAIAAKPDLAVAHAIRALALADKGDPRAAAAADGAIALDDKQELAWMAKGVAVTLAGRFADGEAAFTRAIAINDRSVRSYAGRSGIRAETGRFAEGLADADKALALAPQLPIHAVRGAALFGLGRTEEALAEADRALVDQPKAVQARFIRSGIRAGAGQADGARADLDLLIADHPQAIYYIRRAFLWPSSDAARRLADIEAALKLDPRSTQALAIRASYAIDAGALDRAETDIAAVEKLAPTVPGLVDLRFRLLVRRGRTAEAARLVDAMVAKKPGDAVALNESCWLKATSRIDIAGALADCEASLKLAPDSLATLDSRAFVKLRLDQIDAAIADYDAVLKRSPNMPASLYGRGLALVQKGERDRGLADIAAAIRISPDIAERFSTYGMPPPEAAQADGKAIKVTSSQ